ncbi:dihydroneopterin aldolase [Nocardioides aequoreus]|uniref:dihydroneopterin aldolase n=1 Tax=Nocardioides aequoreus TaxID=397278 RepID=UPI0009FBA722|nr:dihydroneopterin aldolase [Nocardioides aequoreus]
MSHSAAVPAGQAPGPPATPPRRADRLSVRGLRFQGHHGVFEHERREGQEFVVDVTLLTDTRPAALSDELRDTIDYGTLVEQVRAVVQGEPVDLIETLAHRIAEVCLSHPAVLEAEVTVHKPHAPIQASFDDVTLTILRSRRGVVS